MKLEVGSILFGLICIHYGQAMIDIHEFAKPNPLKKRLASVEPERRSSYAKRHDRIHNIVLVLSQGLHGLLAGDARLRHDQFNILSLQASLVNFLAIVLLLLLLLGIGLRALALAKVVVVVVTSVLAGSLGSGKLLGSRGLGLGVQVFDLSLTKNARKSC